MKHNNNKEIPAGYKDSALGIIPLAWEVKRLGEIAEISSGGTPLREKLEYWNGDIPWVTTTLINAPIINNAEEYISELGLKNSAAKILNKGTLLMAMYGQGQTRGKVSILNIDAATNQACASINVSQNNSIFVYYVLDYKYEHIRALSNDGGQKNLSLGLIKDIKVIVPPLEEQRRIAEVLGVWDRGIELQRELVDRLTKRKRALMQQLLTARKRLPNFTAPWQKVKIGDIGTISSAGVDKKIIDGELPVRLLNFLDVYRRDFLYEDFQNQWVTAKEDKVQKCSVRQGDVFFTPSSETPNDIGLSAVAMEDMDNVVYSYHIIRLRLKQKWDLGYRAYAFKTDEFYRQAQRICDGSGQRYVISQDGFRSLEITIPPIAEQKAIAEVLMCADREIEIATRKLAELRNQKRGLMQQLLTGKKQLKIK